MATFIQKAKQFMALQLKIQNRGREEAELAKVLEAEYQRGRQEERQHLEKLARG